MRRATAREVSVCGLCGRRVDVGAEIVEYRIRRPVLGYKCHWVHVECADRRLRRLATGSGGLK